MLVQTQVAIEHTNTHTYMCSDHTNTHTCMCTESTVEIKVQITKTLSSSLPSIPKHMLKLFFFFGSSE